jgi:predicted metal-dependent enzyme (double-stranded beta helix superfamily)
MAKKKSAQQFTESEYFGDFAERLHAIIKGHDRDLEPLRPEIEPIFKDMLSRPEPISNYFVRLATDNDVLLRQLVVMEPNEFVLYYHPKGSFSLRLYVWDDFVYSYIHDHGSWGIYGAWVKNTRVVNYRRVDDGSDREYAELEISKHLTMKPGEINFVQPFDAGIHLVGGDRGISITLNVYGPTRRRGYINRYDIEKKRVTRVFTPRLEKRLLAVRSLGEIGHAVGRDTLERTAEDEYPMVRWESIMSMESIDSDLYLTLLRRALEDPSRRLRARARRELDRRGVD